MCSLVIRHTCTVEKTGVGENEHLSRIYFVINLFNFRLFYWYFFLKTSPSSDDTHMLRALAPSSIKEVSCCGYWWRGRSTATQVMEVKGAPGPLLHGAETAGLGYSRLLAAELPPPRSIQSALQLSSLSSALLLFHFAQLWPVQSFPWPACWRIHTSHAGFISAAKGSQVENTCSNTAGDPPSCQRCISINESISGAALVVAMRFSANFARSFLSFPWMLPPCLFGSNHEVNLL